MRAVRHGRWSLLLAVSLVAFGCGAEKPVEDPAAKEASIGVDQPVHAAAFCSPWDCNSKCCTSFFGVTVCEPFCKTTCETHNLACDPSVCTAIRAADPEYDALKAAWQEAERVGLFSSQDSCELLARTAADQIAQRICGAVGGIYCYVGNAVAEQENLCFCAELDYGSGGGGGGGGGGGSTPRPCSGTCCDWDENGVCTSCVKRPAVCP